MAIYEFKPKAKAAAQQPRPFALAPVDLPPTATASPVARGPDAATALAIGLMQSGVIAPELLVSALSQATRQSTRLVDRILAGGDVLREPLFRAVAAHYETRLVDPLHYGPDPQLIARLGTGFCLSQGVVPLARIGQAVLVATARPEDFAALRPTLEARLGQPVAMAVALPERAEAAVLALCGPRLAARAQSRVTASESCRSLGGWRMVRGLGLFTLGLVAIAAAFGAPVLLWLGLGWTVVTLGLSVALKIAAAISVLWPPRPVPPPLPAARVVPLHLPKISVLVALYREADIAPRLIRRLERLDYPRDRLEVLLIVEAKDHTTRRALLHSSLPPWMRIVTVPEARLMTKPRALNYALDLCLGDIIGVYDAEDAPDPAQLRHIARHFQTAAPDVACLQGQLDFYNPRTNWLSRCFTVEYATWFRLILPGLARLGLPIPLGGTTLFFRRNALESVGAWDAHNVTEDADLGMRLARHGYRTEIVETVTMEEANCRPMPWIKQRSRWIKGYMMTWATHMRDPVLLWRQLGPWRFVGFQVLFLCTISQFLLMPLLWTLWLPLLGLPHPVADALPPLAVIMLGATLFLTELVNLGLGLIGLRRAGQRVGAGWLLTLHIYSPLGAIASYKALWEMAAAPFYWDKTSHGQFDPKQEDP